MENPQLKSIIREYYQYKENFARNIFFDVEKGSKSEFPVWQNIISFTNLIVSTNTHLVLYTFIFSSTASRLPYQVQFVTIKINTATFDKIEKDVKVLFVLRHLSNYWCLQTFKVTVEAALGMIGGTMGLFTGFSILSAVEIIYHLLKWVFQLK